MSVKRLVPTHIFSSTSAPIAQRVGDSYFDPVKRALNIYDGAGWATFSIGGGSDGLLSVDGGTPTSTFVTVIDGGGV